MMRCTEGGDSGTCNAFWETLWGGVVSVDDCEKELDLVIWGWAGSKSASLDFSGRPGE